MKQTIRLPDMLEDTAFWCRLRTHFTGNQWNWIYYHIIGGLSIEEIAIQENTTVEAVTTWGRQVAQAKRIITNQGGKTHELY
ncbi:hypothetical protein [Lentibacillus salinarum]|uniref:Uncharacterized protein n=1 Tax=Lentibacillus salinarum TaxID=446820 RepID=A0ABW3ZTX6_9BACI